jgi:hypothetical protein
MSETARRLGYSGKGMVTEPSESGAEVIDQR